jgi:23S rRNA (uracil1939-C5)-methyltransferase
MPQLVTLELTQMAHGGPAMGRYQGKVFFVPYALPGETVGVEIETSKKGWARARLREVIEPSPERTTPACPHFGPDACGGCQWQHIHYPAQLHYKTDVVRDQLARLGGLNDAPVRPARAVGDPWGYRNHVQLHSSPGGLGYVSADGERVEPIDTCPIMHPLISELYGELDIEIENLERLSLRAGNNTGQQLVIFETTGDEPFELMVDLPISCALMLGDGTPVTLVGNDYLFERVAGYQYRVSAGSFFQVNTGGLDNVQIINHDVAQALTTLDERIHAVIADPPRNGCGPDVVRRLASLRPERFVYVACDPATLARDAKVIVESGYSLVEVQPLDLFPQTYHIECVALFVRDALA